MKRWIMVLSIVPLLFLFAIASPVQAGIDLSQWTGNAKIFIGGKFLNESDWFPADDQFEIGLEIDFKMKTWPISIAVDYMHASGNAALLKSETSEFNLGVRKIFDQYGNMHPFVGGGIAIIGAERGGLGVSDDDLGLGIWLQGGVYWTLYEHLNVGVELKYSYAGVDLFGIDRNGGGYHFGGLIGYHY